MTQKIQRHPRELLTILQEKMAGVNHLLGSPLGDERKHSQTTDDGTEHRTKKDGRSIYARSDAPIHGIPHVRNDTGAVGERGDGEKTTEKARDKQGRHVIRAGLADMEECESRESPDKDGPPTDELRAGAPEGGAEHVANEEVGENKVAHFPLHVKVAGDDGDCRGWRRRSKCATDNVRLLGRV